MLLNRIICTRTRTTTTLYLPFSIHCHLSVKPHLLQNADPAGLKLSHFEQQVRSSEPHLLQNIDLLGFIFPQPVHIICKVLPSICNGFVFSDSTFCSCFCICIDDDL